MHVEAARRAGLIDQLRIEVVDRLRRIAARPRRASGATVSRIASSNALHGVTLRRAPKSHRRAGVARLHARQHRDAHEDRVVFLLLHRECAGAAEAQSIRIALLAVVAGNEHRAQVVDPFPDDAVQVLNAVVVGGGAADVRQRPAAGSRVPVEDLLSPACVGSRIRARSRWRQLRIPTRTRWAVARHALRSRRSPRTSSRVRRAGVRSLRRARSRRSSASGSPSRRRAAQRDRDATRDARARIGRTRHWSPACDRGGSSRTAAFFTPGAGGSTDSNEPPDRGIAVGIVAGAAEHPPRTERREVTLATRVRRMSALDRVSAPRLPAASSWRALPRPAPR